MKKVVDPIINIKKSQILLLNLFTFLKIDKQIELETAHEKEMRRIFFNKINLGK